MNGAPILLFGAGGQLGRELTALAHERGVPLVGLTRAEGDITDRAAVVTALKAHRPGLVVNVAAFTAVDRAESETVAAFAANAEGPAILAEATADAGLPLLQVSTDYVFDGSKAGPYVESDPVAPLGAYGASKSEGEVCIRALQSRHIILRTAWVYGVHGANFLKTMLRLAAERDVLRVVADQRGSPTATRDLAEAILAVRAALLAGAEPWGTYHIAGQGETTWHGFASAIIAEQARFTGRHPVVEAITTADYPTPARRPANSVLDSSLFATTFGYRAKPWQERMREVVASLMAQRVS
ncbi:TDP-rhamnose synthetase, NAD(P)-binding protein [Bosea sp. LC85]|uniref:dTDP-4-dehydrorhamnose reductase n=1 Tax=Bosea sp. LC85 TaxID=1502851 RepID=UPI0004E3CFE7|nr:dTDP-4-dehydrorhamnose reductase [Bosea sp. LC85]KFC63296.1 TDP-rhamnose synthetase, NAD(P)-binding protein [Bosea sp. LC85]